MYIESMTLAARQLQPGGSCLITVFELVGSCSFNANKHRLPMLGIQPADVKEGTVCTYLEQRDLYKIQHVSQVLARLPRLTDISSTVISPSHEA